MQNSELDSKFLTSEANYAQVNKKLGIAQAGFQTDVDSLIVPCTLEHLKTSLKEWQNRITNYNQKSERGKSKLLVWPEYMPKDSQYNSSRVGKCKT